MTNVRRTFPLPGEVPHPTGHPGLVDERFQRPTIFTSAGGLEVDSDTSDDRETDRQTDRQTYWHRYREAYRPSNDDFWIVAVCCAPFTAVYRPFLYTPSERCKRQVTK